MAKAKQRAGDRAGDEAGQHALEAQPGMLPNAAAPVAVLEQIDEAIPEQPGPGRKSSSTNPPAVSKTQRRTRMPRLRRVMRRSPSRRQALATGDGAAARLAETAGLRRRSG